MKSLPIAKAGTLGCAVELPLGFDGLSFWLDGNSKITAGNGTYAAPKPNAFSLPAASVSGTGHCPGSTEVCRADCYVRGLAKHAPELYALYEKNAQALDAVLDDCRSMTAAEVLGAWVAANAPHGFRWHVSGDVRNQRHASFIVHTCWEAADVQFWIYTRTLEAIPVLVLADNLAVNVSADEGNYLGARVAHELYGARICFMTGPSGYVPPDLPRGSVIFPNYPQRGRDRVRCATGEVNAEDYTGNTVPCGWSGERKDLIDGCCPDCGTHGPVADATTHPWWQALTHEQRAMVCPTDFFGQSEAHRCGPCRKCMV